MALIISNAYLSQSQMTDNAQYIADYLINKGWTRKLLREYSEICSASPHSTLDYGNPLFTAICQVDMPGAVDTGNGLHIMGGCQGISLG